MATTGQNIETAQ